MDEVTKTAAIEEMKKELLRRPKPAVPPFEMRQTGQTKNLYYRGKLLQENPFGVDVDLLNQVWLLGYQAKHNDRR